MFKTNEKILFCFFFLSKKHVFHKPATRTSCISKGLEEAIIKGSLGGGGGYNLARKS